MDAEVVRQARERIGLHLSREAILGALHEGREERWSSTPER